MKPLVIYKPVSLVFKKTLTGRCRNKENNTSIGSVKENMFILSDGAEKVANKKFGLNAQQATQYVTDH